MIIFIACNGWPEVLSRVDFTMINIIIYYYTEQN